jgi:hypothetical protein
LLVGSGDKFELVPELRHRFGSNEGLARSRAEWVKQAIGVSFNVTIASLTLTSDSSRHGTELVPGATAADRSVAVYAVFREAPPLPSGSRTKGEGGGTSARP